MNASKHPGVRLLAGPGVMLLSAGLFGYFGFMMLFPEVDSQTGKLIPVVVMLKWTLRCSAIVFFASALLTMVNDLAGNLLYLVIGLLSAVLFIIVGVWDINSTYTAGVHPFLLFVFAAWNGYGSWMGLKALMAVRGASGSNHHVFGSD